MKKRGWYYTVYLPALRSPPPRVDVKMEVHVHGPAHLPDSVIDLLANLLVEKYAMRRTDEEDAK